MRKAAIVAGVVLAGVVSMPAAFAHTDNKPTCEQPATYTHPAPSPSDPKVDMAPATERKIWVKANTVQSDGGTGYVQVGADGVIVDGGRSAEGYGVVVGPAKQSLELNKNCYLAG